MVRVISTACLTRDHGVSITNADGCSLFYDGGRDTLRTYTENGVVTNEAAFLNVTRIKPKRVTGGKSITRSPRPS